MKKKETDHIVRKHNYLVNSTTSKAYSVIELKFIAKIISLVHKNDTNLESKKLYLRDLEFVQDNTNNHLMYEKIFTKLRKRKITLPDGTETGWLSSFKANDEYVKNGYVEYSIDTRLKNYIVKLNDNNKQYYLSNVISLSSRYSIHIYELLNQLRDIKHRTIFLADLKAILSIPDSYNISNIEKKVLQVAQLEINKKTDIKFNYELLKDGKKTTAVRFDMKCKLHSSSQLNKTINLDMPEEERVLEQEKWEQKQKDEQITSVNSFKTTMKNLRINN